VPDYIREHVDLIKPTVHFTHHLPDDPAHLRKRSNDRLGSPTSHDGPKTNHAKVTGHLSMDNCDTYITPDCLRELYQINYTPVVPHLNSYGIGASFISKAHPPLF
jgi:tripeptidyl-peptidase-1